MKKIVINKNSSKKSSGDSDIFFMSFEELITSIRDMSFLKHLFKYKSATLLTYRIHLLSKPLLTSLILLALSPFSSSIEDDAGKRIKINFYFLFAYLMNFIYCWRRRNAILKEAAAEIERIERYGSLNDEKKMALSFRPLYLRTDISFNVVSGGSVGHIAGVINNLRHFTGAPVFISSDAISTVSKKIDTYLIQPDRRFSDFRELWPIYYNRVFESAFEKLSVDFQISFIYQRYSINNYCGLKLAQKYNVPLVLEYNGPEVWVNRHWGSPLKYESLSEKIEITNLKFADLVVVVSKVLKDELIQRGIEEKKILVNPNGVDADKYSPAVDGSAVRRKYSLESRIVIGFIGTFGKWHGAEVLVDAFGKMLAADPGYKGKVSLLMVGDGVTMAKVKELIAKHGIEGDCVITGLVPQKEGPGHLAACDILVSPHVPNADGTPFFGSPTKLFEYMAMGKGIVASDLEQIGEILRHGETAYMVKPGDVDALHAGMKILISDAVLRTRLGENARAEAVAKYTWREHTRKIVERLNEIIMK
ncbi:MAG: GDP-mannose-dependent alpha-(1-6)-phosphatidylinositol monomannoside mannosyltransferase [bacterium ADurb.Bin243]|nr:MAG: GDP-mannose-dependent alpha-(1-6)-phosphatidylinositol monomannoside mannosyltransferase [bacterium ADurb.Bin243]